MFSWEIERSWCIVSIVIRVSEIKVKLCIYICLLLIHLLLNLCILSLSITIISKVKLIRTRSFICWLECLIEVDHTSWVGILIKFDPGLILLLLLLVVVEIVLLLYLRHLLGVVLRLGLGERIVLLVIKASVSVSVCRGHRIIIIEWVFPWMLLLATS